MRRLLGELVDPLAGLLKLLGARLGIVGLKIAKIARTLHGIGQRKAEIGTLRRCICPDNGRRIGEHHIRDDAFELLQAGRTGPRELAASRKDARRGVEHRRPRRIDHGDGGKHETDRHGKQPDEAHAEHERVENLGNGGIRRDDVGPGKRPGVGDHLDVGRTRRGPLDVCQGKDKRKRHENRNGGSDRRGSPLVAEKPDARLAGPPGLPMRCPISTSNHCIPLPPSRVASNE